MGHNYTPIPFNWRFPAKAAALIIRRNCHTTRSAVKLKYLKQNEIIQDESD